MGVIIAYADSCPVNCRNIYSIILVGEVMFLLVLKPDFYHGGAFSP